MGDFQPQRLFVFLEENSSDKKKIIRQLKFR